MVGGTVVAAREEPLSALASRYADVAAASCDISKTAAFAASQNPDGSWNDIDYANTARSRWPAGDHLRVRLRALAADWRINGKEESLLAAHRALGFWLRNRFKNPNWWWNVIGVPQSIGDAALMIDVKLAPDERAGVLEVMDVVEPDFAKTGQNMAWMAENRLRRGLISRDDGVVRSAFADTLGQVRMGNAEGIRSDWCFHQHGEQPQFGNFNTFMLSDGSALVKDKVFSLRIIHGKKPVGASYRYAVSIEK